MAIQMDRNVLFDLLFRSEQQIKSASLLYPPYLDRVVLEGIVV